MMVEFTFTDSFLIGGSEGGRNAMQKKRCNEIFEKKNYAKKHIKNFWIAYRFFKGSNENALKSNEKVRIYFLCA